MTIILKLTIDFPLPTIYRELLATPEMVSNKTSEMSFMSMDVGFIMHFHMKSHTLDIHTGSL